MTALLTGRRILVVEDEMMVLIMIEDMLADLGCTCVTSAATVEQALHFIDTQPFDAACLDVNLDGVESYPVADALVAHGVRFAYSTGYSHHDMRARGGGQPVLRKPYRAQQFTQVFADLLSDAPIVAAVVPRSPRSDAIRNLVRKT